MAFIAAYWWLWLILTGVSLLYMASKVFGIFSGVKKAADGFKDDKFGKVDEGVSESIRAGSSFFSLKTLVINLIGGIAGLLLFLSIVVHLIDYMKQ